MQRRKSKTPGIDDFGFPIAGWIPEPPVPRKLGPGLARSSRILDGLRGLSAQRRRSSFTLREIADACGCGTESIRKIQRKAQRRLRFRLEKDPAFKLLMRQLGEGHSGRMFENLLTSAGIS